MRERRRAIVSCCRTCKEAEPVVRRPCACTLVTRCVVPRSQQAEDSQNPSILTRVLGLCVGHLVRKNVFDTAHSGCVYSCLLQTSRAAGATGPLRFIARCAHRVRASRHICRRTNARVPPVAVARQTDHPRSGICGGNSFCACRWAVSRCLPILLYRIDVAVFSDHPSP